MTHAEFDSRALLSGFTSSGGWINHDVFALKTFPSMGYGAVAIKDISPRIPLFVVPDRLILSGYSGDLHQLLSDEELEALGHGWARLILVMMWEEAKGQSSRWDWYLRELLSQSICFISFSVSTDGCLGQVIYQASLRRRCFGRKRNSNSYKAQT